ncbi:TPA: hypothetical protein ACNGYJ_005897, partial [Klebsiella quasipneumoniae subsp. quasipneumoniae]
EKNRCVPLMPSCAFLRGSFFIFNAVNRESDKLAKHSLNVFTGFIMTARSVTTSGADLAFF